MAGGACGWVASRAILGVLAVWVWGQQFQLPMFLGTQPPYATKALIYNYYAIYVECLSFF